jgi:hypothetical protein
MRSTPDRGVRPRPLGRIGTPAGSSARC